MLRKPSLSEWFLIYQLQKIERKYAHLTFILKVDTTKLTSHFGEKIPFTSLLVKACGLWSRQVPLVRKQVFSTFYGLRVYENETASVNVPILMKHEGLPYMSIMTIENAADKSISEIQKEFAEYSKKEPKDLLIGSRMLGKKNNWFNRMRLKMIHFMVNQFPSIQNKYNVGTVSVSSLMKFEKPHINLTTTAKGPGAFSLCVSSFDREDQVLEIGISWDHQTGDGHEGTKACQVLAEILQGEDEESFKKLIS